MIGTVAIITAKPESAGEVENGMRVLAAATQNEDGCIMYSLQRSLDKENVFVTVEKWESQEALQGHLQAPHLQEALAQFGSLLAEEPVIIPLMSLDAGDPAKNSY